MVYLQTKKFVTHSTFTSSPGGSSFNVYCLTRLVVPRQGLPLDQVICPLTCTTSPGGLSHNVYHLTRLVLQHFPVIQACLYRSTSRPGCLSLYMYH